MKTFLIFTSKALLILCEIKDLSDFLCRVEDLIFKRSCLLATASWRINDKYSLGIWDESDMNKQKYHQEYIDYCGFKGW